MSVTDPESPGSQEKYAIVAHSDLVWGAGPIGEVINRDARATNHMLATGAIECARKKCGRWVASRSALLREFGA